MTSFTNRPSQQVDEEAPGPVDGTGSDTASPSPQQAAYFALILLLGTAKVAASFRGEAVVSNVLDWILSVPVALL